MPRTYVVPDNIALFAGPRIIGIVLNWWLFGILCVQYYLYLSKMKSDRIAIKVIVHAIFVLDTFQTLMMMADVFYWFVNNFGDFEKLQECHYAGINMVLTDALIAFIVQLFYIWRINRLSGRKLIPGVFAVGSLVAIGSCAFITAVYNKAGFERMYRNGAAVWLISSAIIDILIAIYTGYLLLKMAKNMRNKTSDRIMRILTLILETNAITSVVALEIALTHSLVDSSRPPNTMIYASGGYVLGKLYSNCFMILLNQRHNYPEKRPEITLFNPGPCVHEISLSSQPENHSQGIGEKKNVIDVEASL